MKNIKRYLVYFTICLVSLFAFNNNVNAEQVFQLDYETQATDDRLTIYESLKNYIDTNNRYNHDYFIGYNNTTTKNGYFVSIYLPFTSYVNCYKIDYLYYNTYYQSDSSTKNKVGSNIGVYSSTPNQDNTCIGTSYTYYITENDYIAQNTNYTTFINNINTKLNQTGTSGGSNYGGKYYLIDKNGIPASKINLSIDEIYYTSLPIYFVESKTISNKNYNDITTICNTNNNGYDYTLYYNNGMASVPLRCGDSLPTISYFEENQSNSPITITEYLHTTFNESEEESYKSFGDLTISIDQDYENDTTTCEFTDIFNNKTTFNVSSEYEYTTYSNGTLICNIKRNNEVIESQTYNLSSLANLNLVDSYSSSLVGDTLYSVNINYNFPNISPWPTKIPFKIEYLSQDDTELTEFIVGTKFYYTNPNLNKYETTDIKLENFKCRKTHTNYIYCTGFIDNTIGRFQNIDVNFLLADFNEETNILYYDNVPTSWSERDVDFLISSFTGYTKHVLDKNRNKIYIYKATSNSTSNGNIYFPYTLDHSNTIDLIAFYYKENTFNTHLPSVDYDDYYQYFSVNFENEKVLVMTFNQKNFDDFDNYAYFYAPSDWLVQMQGNVQMNVILTNNEGNKLSITGAYNNTDFYDKHDISSLFERVTNELNGIRPLTTEFSNTFTRMWNKISPERQNLIITCFCMIVIISIVLMARRG